MQLLRDYAVTRRITLKLYITLYSNVKVITFAFDFYDITFLTITDIYLSEFGFKPRTQIINRAHCL